MKTKIILIVFLSLSFLLKINAQSEKPQFVGINLIPLLGTAIELGYELNLKPNLAFDFHTGYMISAELAGPLRIGTPYMLQKNAGFFFKIGSRYNFRSNLNKFAPFIGINIVNAIAIEEGFYHESDAVLSEWVEENSYNLGVSGIIGITSPATKRINVDLGVQVGKLLVNNLLAYQSIMPGMGVEFYYELRIQGVLRVKYRIN